MSKRFWVFLLLGAVIAGAAEWELRERILSPIRKLDNFWVEFCMGNASGKIKDPAITMVRITDDYEPVPVGAGGATDTAEGGDLTRLDFAAFLFAIGKLNPKAVSFIPSPVFGEGSVLNQTDIYPLKDAALQLPQMTLGTVVTDEGKPANPAEGFAYPAVQVTGDASSLPEITRTVRPADPELLANGVPSFFSHETVDPLESENPRVQLIARQGDRVVPGFVLSSVARQAGVPESEIVVNLEEDSCRIEVGEFYSIPIARDGTMELPSHNGLSHAMFEMVEGPEGQEKKVYHFASLKVEDVALAAERVDQVAQTVVEEFAGKFESIATNLVLLGFDRSSDRTIETQNDELLTPMTATARAIATIQSGRHFVRWPLWARGAGYGVILVLALIFLSLKRKTVFLSLGATLAGLAAMVLIFREFFAWTPPAAYLGLFVLLILLAAAGPSRKKEAEEKE